MQQAVAGQSNALTYDVVNLGTGVAIISGVVTGYLRARDGVNAGKWWNYVNNTWSNTEVSAGSLVYFGGAAWRFSVIAAAWVGGVTYDFYAKESNNLAVVYSEQVVTWSPPTTGKGGSGWTYTLTSSETGLPIADAEVWATTDLVGNNVICWDYTDTNGQVIFYIPSGTYYVWRRKVGYRFDNPDTEVV